MYDHGALVSGMVGRDRTYKGQKGRGVGGDPKVRPRGVVVLRNDTLLTETRLKRTAEEPVISLDCDTSRVLQPQEQSLATQFMMTCERGCERTNVHK